MSITPINFQNINQIKEEFKIDSDDVSEIKKLLRQKQKLIHPDNNGGNFRSENEKEEFLKIEVAINFIENGKTTQTALIPFEVVSDLVKVVQSLTPKHQESSIETRISEQVQEKISQIRTIYFYPKIGISTVTAFVTYVWLFPKTFHEHPFIGLFLESRYGEDRFFFIWFSVLIISGFLWVFILFTEEKQKNLRLKLKLEYFQNELFKQFLEEFRKEKEGEHTFTKDDFAIYLNQRRKMLPLLAFMLGQSIDIELAQSLAEIVFARDESKGIIEKATVKSFSDTYKLVE